MPVLIVEDDNEMREALADSFREKGFAVDACGDGQSALRKAVEYPYDLIMLDIGLPEMGGREVCRLLRARGVETPIIMLSVEGEVATKIELLALGADDYLTKPFSFEELLARVQALLRHPRNRRGDTLRVGDVVLNTAGRNVICGKKDVHLTPKEFSLLEYLMRNQGTVISRRELLEHVWDINADPFTNTIETHILTLRNKIKSKKGKRIIQTVPGVGYKID